MRQFLNRLRRTAKKLTQAPAARPAPRPARPGLEPLDERVLLTASRYGYLIDVSDTTRGSQHAGSDRAVATAPDGTFAVAWDDDGDYNGTGGGIYARLYSANGAPRTGPIRIPGTNAASSQPSIAMSALGRFAVAWTQPYAYNAQDLDIFAQKFDAAGNLFGSPIQIAYSSRAESEPSLAMDTLGTRVKAAYTVQNSTTGLDVMYREFDFDSTNTSEYANVRQLTLAASARNESAPSLASSNTGRSVVSYTYGFSATDQDVHAQLFDSFQLVGGPLYVATGGTRTIDSQTTEVTNEFDSSAAITTSGDAVIAYTVTRDRRYSPPGGFSSTSRVSSDVFVRLTRTTNWPSGGTTLSTPIQVGRPEYTATHFESDPSVAIDQASGSYVVAYTYNYTASSSQSPADLDVRAQRFDNLGNRWGGDVAISAIGLGPRGNVQESMPSVALDRDGNFVVVLAGSGMASKNRVYRGGSVEFPVYDDSGVFFQLMRGY